jgi:hypothetical protein
VAGNEKTKFTKTKFPNLGFAKAEWFPKLSGALRKWLSDNPIPEEQDIDSLSRAGERHRHVCIAAQSSNVTEQEGLALNWTGNVPFCV